MGWNTTVLVLNDRLEEIKEDYTKIARNRVVTFPNYGKIMI